MDNDEQKERMTSSLQGLRVAIVTASERPQGGVEQITNILRMALESRGAAVRLVGKESVGKGLWATLRFRLAGGVHRVVGRHFMRKWARETDVVICNGEFGYGVSHPKAVVCFHGSYLGYGEALKPIISPKVFNGLMRLAEDQRVAAIGKTVMTACDYNSRVCARQGIKTDFIIHNPVDGERFKMKPDVPRSNRCLYVGASDYWGKGFDVLDAMANSGIFIDCVTSKRPSNHRLNWLGGIPNQKLGEVYPRYSALLLPSRFEGFGLVVLEAMACGTPVIMSNVGFGSELARRFPEFVVSTPHETMASAMAQRFEMIKRRQNEYAFEVSQYVRMFHSIDMYTQQWEKHILRL